VRRGDDQGRAVPVRISRLEGSLTVAVMEALIDRLLNFLAKLPLPVTIDIVNASAGGNQMDTALSVTINFHRSATTAGRMGYKVAPKCNGNVKWTETNQTNYEQSFQMFTPGERSSNPIPGNSRRRGGSVKKGKTHYLSRSQVAVLSS
jgi:hypothetical protein